MGKLTIKFRFGATPIDLLNSPDMTFKSAGLFAYLQSKPDGWNFDIKRIARQKKEGVDAIRSGIHELEEHGYLVRKPVKNNDGTWGGYDYILYGEPSSEKSTTVKSSTDSPVNLSNKDYSNKEIVRERERGYASKSNSHSLTKTSNENSNILSSSKQDTKTSAEPPTYQGITQACESSITRISSELLISQADVRNILIKMAAYYVGEGKSKSNYPATLLQWCARDLAKGDIEVDTTAIRKRNDRMEVERRKPIYTAFFSTDNVDKWVEYINQILTKMEEICSEKEIVHRPTIDQIMDWIANNDTPETLVPALSVWKEQ
jgi:hypothetical protein